VPPAGLSSPIRYSSRVSALPSFHCDLRGELWIGVDWGGSGARVRRVGTDPGGEGLVGIGPDRRIEWPRSDWRPLPLAEQLRADAPSPDERERAEAELRLELLSKEIHASAAGERFQLAVAAPGLRTADGRGVGVVRNGPRIPRLLDELAERLGTLPPIRCTDGLAGAWGERVGRGGGLAGVENGWYLGGGSGIAEGLVSGGLVHELPAEFPRPWQLEGPGGTDFEGLLAPSHVNREWAERSGAGETGFVEDRAAAGDARAREFLAELDRRLAAFVELRRASFEELTGSSLERIVIGQAWTRILASLELPPLVRLSNLREAPVLGAVAQALFERERGERDA